MKQRIRKWCYAGFPLLGVLFYLAYLQRSAIDMVYSDYIRLINSYLPDVWNPEKFFVPDLLTRIPVNYLERGLNVELFGYSVTFDRIMGVLGFGLSALVIGMYARRQRIGLGWYASAMAVMFSLNKWEMLYNGTGWAHFLAFACFFFHYYLLDRVYEVRNGKRTVQGERVSSRKWRRQLVWLAVLPALITIGTAGPYCAIYTMTLVLAYLFIEIRNQVILHQGIRKVRRELEKAGERPGAIGVIDSRTCELGRKQVILLLAAAIWPLLLYLWSNSQAVYEYSGAVDTPLFTAFFQDPKFFIKFFLKSFASTVFGVELISRQMTNVPDMAWYLLGAFVLASYGLAVWMNFYYRISERTIFPLMLLAGGGMNHLLILVSRYIFMPNDNYGMSSRYALQYQLGVLGILLTFGLVFRRKKSGEEAERTEGKNAPAEKKSGKAVYLAAFLVTAVFLCGNLVTTAEEFSFGVHRKNYNLETREMLLNFEQATDEELEARLEYHKPGCREALEILKEHHWNIFRESGTPQ